MRARSRREVSFRRTEQGTTNIGINSTSTITNTNSNCNSHNNLDVNHYQDFVQGHPQECLPHRNQRWVHLPVTICEALRTFGAEFNCFLPCRSSCMASNNKEEKVSHHHHHHTNGDANAIRSDSSCGAVFARWLVVGGEEERNCSVVEAEDEDDMPRRSQRRHVLEDIVIEGDKCELKNEIFEEEKQKEEGRVSICIPPKNALLLMRCRSDPVKMAALANRFWECPPPQEDEAAVNEEEEEAEEEEEEVRKTIVEEARIPEAEAELEAEAQVEAESKGVSEVVQQEELQKQVQEEEEVEEEDKQVLDQPAVLEEAAVESDSNTETLPDPDNEQNVAQLVQENENFLDDETEPAPKLEEREAFDDIEDKRPSFSCSSEVLPEQEQESEVAVAEDSTEQKEEEEEEGEETETTSERSEPEEPETGQESEERASRKENLLPDCLLLMMCEPKLSMEVSKETWVCSTDFIRWQPSEKKPPPQIVNKMDGCDEKPKERVSVDNAAPAPQQQQQKQPQLLLMQPPRSSCSFPAAPPLPPALGAPSVKTMNTMIEQKLVGAKTSSYEPFALTRCKSEPRKQSAKLAPETCFWKNRKIEPHRPATLGVGAAGIGF